MLMPPTCKAALANCGLVHCLPHHPRSLLGPRLGLFLGHGPLLLLQACFHSACRPSFCGCKESSLASRTRAGRAGCWNGSRRDCLGDLVAIDHTLTVNFVCSLPVFLYCFPAISLLGLFPQIDTFCVYLLEQIDMLFFGGSGRSLTSYSSCKGV